MHEEGLQFPFDKVEEDEEVGDDLEGGSGAVVKRK